MERMKSKEDWFKKGGQKSSGDLNRKYSSAGKSQPQNLSKSSKAKKETKTKEENALAIKIVDWIVKISLYLTIFLLPLFFWTNVPSPLELNKQFVLVAVVGVGFLAWIGKMAWKNEMKLRKSFALIPVMTFLLIYGLSAVFSGYFEQSMWGYFGGESKAFVTVLFLAALFILIFNNARKSSDIVKLTFVFLIGGTIVALYGFLQLIGVHPLPVDGTDVKTFNTIGSVYIFGVYTAGLLIVAISLFLSSLSKIFKIILVLLSFFLFTILMAVNFKLIWISLMIILAIILGVTIILQANNPGRLLPMIFLVLTLMMILRSQPVFNISDMPVEVSLNYKTSAQIAMESIKQNPMLGSGPTTFANVYKINRPEKLGDFSAVNFSESTSYFFTLASTVGILGILSFMFLTVTGLVFLFKGMMKVISGRSKSKVDIKDNLLIANGMLWLYSTIILYFYFANITLLMLWWFSFAMLLAVYYLKTRNEEEIIAGSQAPKTSFTLSLVFVLVIIGFIASIYIHGQKYVAAVKFQESLEKSASGEDPAEVSKKVLEAVSLDPNRDVYYRNLAMAHLAEARKVISEKGLYDLSPEDSNKISSNFKTALEALNKAKALDDKDSLNFVFIANLYKEFIPIQEGVGEKALENYRKAIELDPKNPDLYQSIAGVYVTLSDLAAQRQAQQQAQAGGQGKEPELPQKSKEYLSLAEENLQTAISIRPYHPGSNVMLVTVYQRYNQPDKAIEKAKENIQKFPNTPELYFNLGSIYYGRENYEEARDQLLEAVKLNDKYSNARYFLGLAYNKLGDNEKAIAQFEKVQEFNSDNEEVGKIIENLKNGNDPLEGLQAPQQSGQPEVDTPVPQEELPSNNEGVTPEIGEETPPVEQSGEELQPVDENPEPEEETISDEEGEEEDEENEEDAE